MYETPFTTAEDQATELCRLVDFLISRGATQVDVRLGEMAIKATIVPSLAEENIDE